jgi:hypothetical protein
VISVNAFEHILRLDEAIDAAFYLVNKNGSLVTQYGPIWSSIKGSRFWINNDLNFMKPGPVPPFAHLLMEQEELAYYLKRYGFDKPTLDQQQTSADLSSRSGCGSQPIPATSRRCSKPLR